MKHIFFPLQRTLFTTLVLAAFLVSCDKDDDPIENNKTITAIVVDNDDFSMLETAVIKANLQATLSASGPFTVFAPDDDAFSASGISAATINSLSQQQMAIILLYHTLGTKVLAADVPAGPNAKVITASGDSVFVTKNANGVFVNGIEVEQADINASNGVIHQIGRVLLPPAGNLVVTAQFPLNGLDSLVKAVMLANNSAGGDPSLMATLQTATLTLFAPSNEAFTQLLTSLGLSEISQVPVTTLLAVLRYHLVAGRVFTSDLSNGSLSMLAGGNATINLTDGANGGVTITGNGNAGNKSNITATNILAGNGVIHVIDRVLVP